MEKALELLNKFSPLAYLILGWTIGSYFLQRKHKKEDRQNDEIRNVLLGLLDICNEITTLANELLFKTHKSIHKVRSGFEQIKGDSALANYEGVIDIDTLNFEKTKLNDLINSSTQEDIVDLKNKLEDLHKMLDTLKSEITDLKKPSHDFIERFESCLQKLNLAKISIIKNESQIKEKIDSLSKLIKEFILISIKENLVVNSKLAYIAEEGTSLSSMVSRQLKQL